MYNTELQVIDQFGDDEIAAIVDEGTTLTGPILRTQLEGGDMSGYTQGEQDAAAAAESKIVLATEHAQGIIDGYLATRYTLPLPNAPKVLSAYSLDITRYRLWDNKAPEEVRTRYEDAIRWLRDVSLGKADLGLPIEDTTDSGPVERTHDETDRVFTMTTLLDY